MICTDFDLIGHQDSSSSNDYQGDMPYSVMVHKNHSSNMFHIETGVINYITLNHSQYLGGKVNSQIINILKSQGPQASCEIIQFTFTHTKIDTFDGNFVWTPYR